MQLSRKPYQWIGKDKDKGLQISMELRGSEWGKRCLDWTGSGWVDSKIGLVRATLPRFKVVLTDQDLICHDDYIEQISNPFHPTTVVLVFTGKDGMGASKKRLRLAATKLRSKGIKVRYFVHRDKAERFIASL